METGFGTSAPYTVGVEEEFQLVDPKTGSLSPAIDAVLAARGAAALSGGSVASELFASCVEVRSPIYDTVTVLAEELPALRRRVRDLVKESGWCLAAAGTHPFSDAAAQQITDKQRYRGVEEEMGWTARMQAIYGLHIHVAVPDEEAAIRAMGILSRHVPLFVALSANSPFWRGSDTRLSSTRIKVFGLVPHSGLPPRFCDWEEFERHVEILVASGNIPDYTWCWWDVRPHPKFGTVELRAPDVQTEADHATSLIALTQCLVATTDERGPENPLFTEENKWLATRYGLDATFYDFSTGEKLGARKLAHRLVNELRSVSQDLGCENELEGVLEIAGGGNGAEKQRAVFKKHNSMEDVIEYLIATTT
ncbi:MAG: glutamate--cysteine ligase [Actinomycetota bacterium]|nr:glutamate--cysteine ligase [Actinomycetota bacterium]